MSKTTNWGRSSGAPLVEPDFWRLELFLSTEFSHLFLFFFFLKILFIYSWETHREREREREREKQAEGEAGSMQGAPHGTQSLDSRITPWAEGRCSTAEPPRDPYSSQFGVEIYQLHKSIYKSIHENYYLNRFHRQNKDFSNIHEIYIITIFFCVFVEALLDTIW